MGYLQPILALLGLLILMADSARAENKVRLVPIEDISTPHLIQQKKKWSLLMGFESGVKLGELVGGHLRLGYQWGILGIDLDTRFGRASFGVLVPRSDYSSSDLDYYLYPSYVESSSELNRPRSDSDSWTYAEFGPGLSVQGNLLPQTLPLLSHRARFGINYALYNDSVNSIAFRGLSFSFEAALQYVLGSGSPWMMDLSAAYRVGEIFNPLASSHNVGRLPIQTLTSTLAVVYWL